MARSYSAKRSADRTTGSFIAKGPKGRAQIMERFSKIPVQAEAGVHDVVVAFIDRSHVESPHNIADPFFDELTKSCSCAPPGRRNKLVDGVVISGPFNPKGVSRTPSRDLIFVCDPKAKGESSCARQITENLAHRAFRRPVTADEVTRLMQFYDAARKDGGTFDQGIEQVVAAVLASPNFLYREISGAPVAGRGGANTELALTDLELASRLSFFLWNTGPDQELLTLAESRGLTKPGAIGKTGAAHVGGSQGLQPGQQLCDEVAESRQPGFREARPRVVPGIHRSTAA